MCQADNTCDKKAAPSDRLFDGFTSMLSLLPLQNMFSMTRDAHGAPSVPSVVMSVRKTALASAKETKMHIAEKFGALKDSDGNKMDSSDSSVFVQNQEDPSSAYRIVNGLQLQAPKYDDSDHDECLKMLCAHNASTCPDPYCVRLTPEVLAKNDKYLLMGDELAGQCVPRAYGLPDVAKSLRSHGLLYTETYEEV